MTGLFTDIRRHKPLSVALVGVLLTPATAELAQLTEEELNARPGSDIVARLLEAHWRPPRLGSAKVDLVGQGERHPRVVTEGTTSFVSSARFSVRWEIDGRADWVDYWPDRGEDPGQLRAVDEAFPPPDPRNEADREDWNRLVELSSILYQRNGSGVTTFVDIPRSDDVDPQSARLEEVSGRERMLAGYLDAVWETAEAVKDDAAERLLHLVERRRSDLRWNRELRQGLAVAEGPACAPSAGDTALVPDEMFGMEREPYNGFRIDHEPSAENTHDYRDHWFAVFPEDAPKDRVFAVRMRVRYDYALRELPAVRPMTAASQLALDLGVRWVHGLVDTERYDRGQIYELDRTEAWDPRFADADLVDERLRIELLAAFRGLHVKQSDSSAVLQIDVRGFGDVLGVSHRRVRALIRLMVTEGLLKATVQTFALGPEDGYCSITGEGLRTLRDESQAGPLTMIYVDDIDSFARVREVAAQGVASDLEEGLLKVPEAQVKRCIQEILGENFDHRDWGGERSDIFTTQLKYGGRRIAAAFLLKGPGTGRDTMYPTDLGKRGDQDLRLFTEPAELFVVQFNGKIDSSVHSRVRTTAYANSSKARPMFLCFIDGTDTARMLRAYGKLHDGPS